MDRRQLQQRIGQRPVGRFLAVAAVLLFTSLGLYLRYTYARTSSPYIDEYTTMWVALRTLRFGYPVFSTGALYAQGLAFTYVDALFFKLFGFGELVARMPSIILSAGYIPLAYLVGKRIFSRREGLLTCALVALDPQSIGWGGRARNYTLLVFLVLLAVHFLYQGVVRQDRVGYRRLVLLFFLGAVFTHNEAILLYPALLAVALLWRGWRWFLQWSVIVENLLVVGGMGLSFYLYRLMQPAGWSEVGEGRGEVALTLDLLKAWGRLRPFFLGPDQLPFVGMLTILVVVGFGYLLVQSWRKGPKQLLEPTSKDAGLVFLNVVFVLVTLAMLLFVSEGRIGTRYLFMLGPVFFLIASAMLVRGLEFFGGLLEKRGIGPVLSGHRLLPTRYVVVAAILVLVTVFSLPSSLGAANRRELEYDLAFEYVRDHLREGDRVMTFATSACLLYLGKCDYVAVEKEFHAYATKRGEHWVEAWAGAPILFTDDALQEAIEQADRMWFVIDQMRFRTRYSSGFIQYVWDHMDLVKREDGVFVFLSGSSHYPTPKLERSCYFALGEQAALLGYGLNDDLFKPGDEIYLSLRWEGLTHILTNYSVFVHLVGADGNLWAQDDGAPIGGQLPTTHWVAGERMPEVRKITLPSDIPPGRYRLQVGMYDPESLKRLPVLDERGNQIGDTIILDYVQVRDGTPELLSPQNVVAANLGDQVTLRGYDVDLTSARPGETVRLVLYWEAEGEIEEEYTVFVHLIDDAGRIWGQQDGQPENGFYPTCYWDVGEVVRDEYEVMIEPDAPPGLYYIQVGMYLVATGERLPYIGGDRRAMGDAMVLSEVRVRE